MSLTMRNLNQIDNSSRKNANSEYSVSYSKYNDSCAYDDTKEMSFCGKAMSSQDIVSIISLFESTEELDLSHNNIDCAPIGLPRALLALNFSYNSFRVLMGFEQLKCLRLLKLDHNKITSTWGLQLCTALEYLDLSHNKIKIIEGIESLAHLKVLVMEHNLIKVSTSIRSLSFTKSLEELSLVGNPIVTSPAYRGTMKHLVPSLVHLDGVALLLRDLKLHPRAGYELKFKTKTLAEEEAAAQWAMPPESSPAFHASVKWSARPNSIDSVASPESYAPSEFMHEEEEEEDKLPWRRTPFPIPRDRTGKVMFVSEMEAMAVAASTATVTFASPLKSSQSTLSVKSKIRTSNLRQDTASNVSVQSIKDTSEKGKREKWRSTKAMDKKMSTVTLQKRKELLSPRRRSLQGSEADASINSSITSALTGGEFASKSSPHKYRITLGTARSGAFAKHIETGEFVDMVPGKKNQPPQSPKHFARPVAAHVDNVTRLGVLNTAREPEKEKGPQGKESGFITKHVNTSTPRNDIMRFDSMENDSFLGSTDGSYYTQQSHGSQSVKGGVVGVPLLAQSQAQYSNVDNTENLKSVSNTNYLSWIKLPYEIEKEKIYATNERTFQVVSNHHSRTEEMSRNPPSSPHVISAPPPPPFPNERQRDSIIRAKKVNEFVTSLNVGNRYVDLAKAYPDGQGDGDKYRYSSRWGGGMQWHPSEPDPDTLVMEDGEEDDIRVHGDVDDDDDEDEFEYGGDAVGGDLSRPGRYGGGDRDRTFDSNNNSSDRSDSFQREEGQSNSNDSSRITLDTEDDSNVYDKLQRLQEQKKQILQGMLKSKRIQELNEAKLKIKSLSPPTKLSIVS